MFPQLAQRRDRSHIHTMTTQPASMTTMPHALALYVHIPFCKTRCTYCAFNTYTGKNNLILRYMWALERELGFVGPHAAEPVATIYFGGGTPSLVPPSAIGAFIRRAGDIVTLSPDPEITLEANPGTVDEPALRDMARAGVNRLSIGMQSANAGELRLFARGHNVDDVRRTVMLARRAGFANISLDLIYGVPGQPMAIWQHSLNTALSMNPDHLSMYSLGIEDGTPMQRWVERGTVAAPDADLAADMIEWATEHLAAQGFIQYEISNWCRPGRESRHNLHYWRNLPYLGLGAGAHGYAARTRYSTALLPEDYIARIEAQRSPMPYPLSAAAVEVEPIDDQAAMAEHMIMGLRLTGEGVAGPDFRARYGRDLWDVFGAELDNLITAELIERMPDDRVRLTARGRLLGNHVFAAFV
jgi:oxygen-independent coproporphyrinogen III oxidase